MSDLVVLVPTRGRPGNLGKVIGAWDFTNAWDVADLVVIADTDDPEIQGYRDVVAGTGRRDTGQPMVWLVEMDVWMPMVSKLDIVARSVAQGHGAGEPPFALGFAGDDHLPQTINWAKRYLNVMHEMKTGMVYGDDGYQGANLSTEWAVTADAVRALGRMVPAPVEHMYCDNAMMDLFGQADALRHLPEVRIEHMHPIAGKAETDAQYQRVNHRDQFRRDRSTYETWKRRTLPEQLAAIRKLRTGLAPVTRPKQKEVRRMSRSPLPRRIREIPGVTPDEVAVTMADLAAQVESDQAVVELGVYRARTTIAMAWGARQGRGAHVWGIDPWGKPGNVYGDEMGDLDGVRRWANYHVYAGGYSNHVTLVHGFSSDVAQTWSGPPVGLLFVDGDHTYPGVMADVRNWATNLAPDAVIAFDDYRNDNYPDVAEAVDQMVQDGVLAPVEVFHDRLGVTRLGPNGLIRTSEEPAPGLPAAITSEGVSPSPYPAVGDQVAVAETYDLGPATVTEMFAAVDELDTQETDPSVGRTELHEGELGGVAAGTSIDTLNLGQLRTLAKKRGIKLGARKDLKASILQALRDGA